MATQDRPCARDIRNFTYDSAKVSQGPALRPSILGCKFRRAKNNERPGASLSVFLCRAGLGQIARGARDDCTSRQKISARNARRDSRTISNREEHMSRQELVAPSGPFQTAPVLLSSNEKKLSRR